MTAARAQFVSYSRLRRSVPDRWCVVEDASEIRELLWHAAAEGRQVTVRAGGRSFDDQALSRDTLLDVRRLDRILALDPARRRITVQAAATWGHIVAAALPHGLMPHIVVTTAGATAGGTLSGNCISRFSPSYGHTGDHVLSFQLLTVGGELLTCSRHENEALFHAAIGGFGYLGVITEVTFDLLAIGSKTRLKTVIERREGLAAFVACLRERSAEPGAYRAVYSVFSLANPQRGAVLRSAYSDEPLGRQLPLHAPQSWYRPLVEYLFMSSRVSNALSHASYRMLFSRGPFVEDLRGYTFCMDGNVRATALADGLGLAMKTTQQSFLIPPDALLAFLEQAAREFRASDVYPNMLDALFLPRSSCLLSSAHELPGFCVSFVFAGLRRAKHQRVHRCLVALNEACLRAGGRIHLVKNVCASKEQIARMYGNALPEFRALKAKHDPQGVLRNDFFTRTLASGSAQC
jgi:decaprenylphospho-beta-D-ribofuranose 2-oxidase